MEKIDYKKKYKGLYVPDTIPSLIEVPEIVFMQIDGCGNPNEEKGAYQMAVETLYAVSYGIKILPKSGNTPPGYFDYVVPPLEGLWWLSDPHEADYRDKDTFCWTAMIRQPAFVTADLFALICEKVQKKKPHLEVGQARLVAMTEGICVQCMHHGSFDEEPVTLEKMKVFMAENGLACDLSSTRKHHEIYLSDPRKIPVSKMRTVLRYPVRKV